MSKARILDPSESYTFSKYAQLAYDTADILAEFGVTLKIEYPVQVSNWLKGSFDYFIPTEQNLLVIEAENADLARGFTQLAVELIALDQWTDSTVPMLYGTVTTGDTWKFGIFQRQEKIVHKDINTYAIPSDLDLVLSTLFGISLS